MDTHPKPTGVPSTKTNYGTRTQADITHAPHHYIGRTHTGHPKSPTTPNMHTPKKFQIWNTQYTEEAHHTYNTNTGMALRDWIHPYTTHTHIDRENP